MSAKTTPHQPPSTQATHQQLSLFDNNVDASAGWTPSKTPRSRGSLGTSMNPSEEWARLFQAAERRKVQNRNAQRKYRRSLKQRLESLEEQGAHVGSRNTSASSTSSDASGSSASSRPHANSSSSSISSTASLETCPQEAMDAQMNTSQSQNLVQTNWTAQTPDLWSTSCTPNGMMLPRAQMEDMFGTSMPQLDSPMEYLQQSVEMPDQTSLSSYFDQYPQSNNGMGLAISDISGVNPTHSMCQADLSQLHAVSATMLNTTNVCDSDLLCPAPPSTPYSSPGLRKIRSRSPLDPPAGVNPLHLAAMRGFDSIIKLLLEQGADVNEVDANGCTALHLAVENGYQSAVQVLLEHGADFTVKVQ